MRYTLLLLMLLCYGTLFSQEVMTLHQLREEAEIHYPNMAKEDLLLPEFENKRHNLHAGYYPRIHLGGRASWQSDVPAIKVEKVDENLPFVIEDMVKIPQVRKDNYRITLDLSQVIWDGGVIRYAKEAEAAALAVAVKQQEAEVYRLGETVNELFFRLLILKEQEKVLGVLREELASQLQSMQAAIESGVLEAWNREAMQAEILQVEQQQEANVHQMQGLLEAINLLTGKAYQLDTPIIRPTFDTSLSKAIVRPELSIFDARIQQLKANEQLLYRKRMPVVAGFGQAGYGLPGLNMFKSEFAPWLVAGVTLSWKPWDWKQNRRARLNLQIKQAMLSVERETLKQKFQRAFALQRAQSAQYEAMIIKDASIIAMREKVKVAAQRGMEEGTRTSTDYLTEVNREKQAILNREIHKIALLQSNMALLQISGKINELPN